MAAAMGDARRTDRRLALLLNNEIAAVVTAMRQNTRWSVVRAYHQHAREDEADSELLLRELISVRRRVFQWESLADVAPMEYLTPFLKIVMEKYVSSPITNAALVALRRLLLDGVLEASRAHVGTAMHSVVSAITKCKFESTDPASDGDVFCRILQALLACVQCPSARHLADRDVCAVFQAAYRIAHDASALSLTPDVAEVVSAYARHIVGDMTGVIFQCFATDRPDVASSVPITAYGSMASLPGAAQQAEGATASKAQAEGATVSKAPTGEGEGVTPTPAPTPDNSVAMQAAGHAAGGVPDSAATTTAGARPGWEEGGGATDAAESARLLASSAASGAVHGVAEAATFSSEGPSTTASIGDAGGATAVAAAAAAAAAVEASLKPEPVPLPPIGGAAGMRPGTTAAREVLSLLISIIHRSPEAGLFGLEMVAEAIKAGGQAFLDHADLMQLVQIDLFEAIFHVCRVHIVAPERQNAFVALLNQMCQIVLSIYIYLGAAAMLHVELFISRILLQLAEGVVEGYSVADDVVEVALEGLLDFCNQPSFLHDAYISFDCRIECSNLVEDICALLSRKALPSGSKGIEPMHAVALEGLLCILSALGRRCDSPTGVTPAPAFAMWEPAEYVDIWQPLLEGRSPDFASDVTDKDGEPEPWVIATQREKAIKMRLGGAAEHYNRSFKKGIQFLEEKQLIPATRNPQTMAAFLRMCPGLSKKTVGEMLGERDQFLLEVLAAYTHTFDFTTTSLDVAIRTYLESFQLAGEGQKIDRVVEAFAKVFSEQQPELLEGEDAIHIVVYAVIMLNTSLHSRQVKDKDRMTLAGFKSQLRGTNNGKDPPIELVQTLFDRIKEQEITVEGVNSQLIHLTAAELSSMAVRSRTARGCMSYARGIGAFDRDIFGMLWGPAVHAIAAVLEGAADTDTLNAAVNGLKTAAHIAAHHHIEEVIDSLVASLCRFTTPLNPTAAWAAVSFGQNHKARAATEAVFGIANRYGDSIRAGWRNILDCIVRLYKLNLLPPSVLAIETGDGPESDLGLKTTPSTTNTGGIKHSSSSFFGAFSFLMDAEAAGPSKELTGAEVAAEEATSRCIEACRIEEMFADSKFLIAGSLSELVKAIIWAAGPLPGAAAGGGGDPDVAQLCLMLLIAMALRNRDRILLLWPDVHLFLHAILSITSPAPPAMALVERAVQGLLRVCQRLLPYKEEVADTLLRSMEMVVKLDVGVAWQLAERIAAEVRALAQGCAPYIRTQGGWNTVCLLLKMTAVSPRARPASYEALCHIMPAHLVPYNFLQCADTTREMVKRCADDGDLTAAIAALTLLESMAQWLTEWVEQLRSAGEMANEQAVATVAMFWHRLLNALCFASCDAHAEVRNNAMVLLHRTLAGSEALALGAPSWAQALRDQLIPLMRILTQSAGGNGNGNGSGGDFPQGARTLRMAVNMLSKTVLQFLDTLRAHTDFPALWEEVLTIMALCAHGRNEELGEAVPEAVKNMLLIVAAKGVLTPEWTDAKGNSLWDLTWQRAAAISPTLQPAMLDAPNDTAPSQSPPAAPTVVPA